MKHSTEAVQKGRVPQGGLSRNGRIYRIAYRKCLRRKRRRKLPLFGLRCLTFAVKDFAYAVKETRWQVRFLHDKITREEILAREPSGPCSSMTNRSGWDGDAAFSALPGLP